MDQTQPTSLSRQELYEKVWQTPMRTLAKGYGLSDSGLAKICKRHNIPRPARGYWARIAVGKNDPKLPLPQVEDSGLEEVQIARSPVKFSRADEPPLARAEHLDENLIIVPETLDKPHPLVAATIKADKSEKPGRPGHPGYRAKGGLPLAVSGEIRERALRIMNALILALEKRGHNLVVESGEYGPTRMQVEVDGELLPITIREPSKREARTQTATERASAAIYSWNGGPRYDFNPTGRLRFEIDQYTWIGIRRHWEDGKRRQLESCLNEMIISFVQMAEENKARRKEKEEEARQRQEWEAQRVEKLRLIEEEENRVKALYQQAEGWARSNQIRAFMQAVRDANMVGGKSIQPGGELDSWLNWAGQQADRLDPLKESPASILDEKAKWKEERGYW